MGWWEEGQVFQQRVSFIVACVYVGLCWPAVGKRQLKQTAAVSSGEARNPSDEVLLLEQRLQLARGVLGSHVVRAADELAVHKDAGHGAPALRGSSGVGSNRHVGRDIARNTVAGHGAPVLHGSRQSGHTDG